LVVQTNTCYQWFLYWDRFSQLKLCFGCVFSWIQNVWGMVYNTLRCKFWVNRGPTDHIRRNRAVTRVTSASRKINFQTWRQNQQRRGSKQVRRSGCVWKWLIPPISPLTNNHDWPVESGILSNSQRSSQNRWAALLVNKPTRAMASQSTWAGGLQQFQCSTFQDLRWQGRCKQTFQSVCGRKSERTFVQAICPSCKLAVFCGVLLPFPFGKESVNTPRPPVTCKFDQHKAYNPLSTSPCLRTLGSEIVPQSVCCGLSPGTPGKNRHSKSYVKLRLHQNQWNSFGKIKTCKSKSGLSRLRALRRQPSSGVPLFKGTQVATKVQHCILSHSHHRY